MKAHLMALSVKNTQKSGFEVTTLIRRCQYIYGYESVDFQVFKVIYVYLLYLSLYLHGLRRLCDIYF